MINKKFTENNLLVFHDWNAIVEIIIFFLLLNSD